MSEYKRYYKQMAKRIKPLYPCIETTLDVTVGDRTVRLWINETDIEFHDYVVTINKVKDFLREDAPTTKQILQFVTKEIQNLNAVQVLDSEYYDGVKLGKVIYTVDFADNKG